MAQCQFTKQKLIKHGKVQKREEVRVCGLACQEGSRYCPRHTFLANIATQAGNNKDARKLAAKEHGLDGRLPQTRVALRQAGYEFKDEGECQGCHQPIEWWLTPKNRRAPFNPMSRDHSTAVSHFATCTNASVFRKVA